MHLRIANSSLVALQGRRTAAVAPCQLQIVHVPGVEQGTATHSRNDLEAGQVPEIRAELDMHQFAVLQVRARWLVEGLARIEDRVLEVFLVNKPVDSDLTVFWSGIGTSNISGKYIDPKDIVCEIRSRTELTINVITRTWWARYVGWMHIGALVGNKDG